MSYVMSFTSPDKDIAEAYAESANVESAPTPGDTNTPEPDCFKTPWGMCLDPTLYMYILLGGLLILALVFIKKLL
jgi:hypothetical protein